MAHKQKITEVLYRDHILKIFRHIYPDNVQNTIVQRIKIGSLNPSERALVKHHLQTASQVKSAQVLDLVDYALDNEYLTCLCEDFDCIPLASLIVQDASEGRISTQKFLQLALSIVDGLEAFHSANLIHRALSPFTIGLHRQTGKVKILSFGIERHLTKEILCLHEPEFIRKVIPYISPEQTGRMNRTVDCRSDFYSLGAILFELLTGKPPFVSDDPMEVVHSHIARRPEISKEGRDTVSLPILAVIFRLLEKTAEGRYQSCYGLKEDLLEISKHVRNVKQLANFVPGKNDRGHTFQIPEKIYGRDREKEELITAYNRAKDGNLHVAMVCGAPGIGKTVLINEIHKPIVADRGHFISGKFDQYSKEQPYSAIVQAFSKLLRQCISDSEENIYQWINGLNESLGDAGKVIVDILPDLELLIGKQPPVAEVGPIETKNRFFFYFSKFVKVFAQENHPLVLFLDDLQWADTSSVELIEQLISNAELHYFFFLGSYRSNEVSPSNPLPFLLKEIERANIPIKTIQLGNIGLDDIEELLCDTLHLDRGKATSLAKEIEKKTGGNPFFVREFLKAIHREEALVFDHQSGWKWDLAAIASQSATDNIVELMTRRIREYDEASQFLLKIAACIGSKFDLEIIAHVAGKTMGEILSSFTEPADDGVIRIEEVAYFFHDRIYEAVYNLMSVEERSQLHYAVGRYLLDKLGEDSLGDQLIYVADQLVSGISHLHSKKEQLQLVRVVLSAARKAKMSNAYKVSQNFLATAWDLFEDDRWEKHYSLTLAISNERAEISYLLGELDKMRGYCQVILEQAKSPLEKVKAYEIQIRAHESHAHYQQAMDLCLEICSLLGLKIPRNPKKYQIAWQMLKTKNLLRKKTLEDLQNATRPTDENINEVLRILYLAGPAMYFANKWLSVYCIFKRMQLLNTFGASSTSAATNASYALLLCGALREFRAGYKFGLLALKNVEEPSNAEFRGATIFRFNSFVRFWLEPLGNTIKPHLEAYHRCLESGDIAFAPYPTFVYTYTAMLIGKPISEFLPNIKYMVGGIKQLKQEHGVQYVNVFLQAIDNLLSQTENPVVLKGEYCDEVLYEKQFAEDTNVSGFFGLYAMKSILGYLFGDFPVALDSVKKFHHYRDGGTSSYLESLLYFYDPLIRLALMIDGDLSEKSQHLKSIRSSKKMLAKFAASAPMNYQNKLLLVEAELARFQGKNEQALEYYNQSLETSIANGFINEAAMASERLAGYYLENKKQKYASFFLNDALRYYHEWGAVRKTAHLVEQYHPYLDKELVTKIAPKKTEEQVTYDKAAGFDFASFQKTANTISGEIVLENLLAKLMTTLLENAGAQKGCLLLYDKQNRLKIEAEANIEVTESIQLKSVPLHSYNMIPRGVISYVARTGETAIFGSNNPTHNFQSDPYIKTYAPKSVLSTPLFNKGKMTGIIYLENNLAEDAFTKERVDILRALSGQIAIAIDNALLYSTLEKKNVELSDALTRAKISARVKNEFVANTSHELRTPLNAIINIPERIQAKFFETETIGLCKSCQAEFSLDPEDSIDDQTVCPSCQTRGQMVESQSAQFTGDPSRVLKLLDIVVNSGQHLMRIVDDILDVSKLEAGKMQLFVEEVGVDELIEQVVATTKGLSVKHKVEVIKETSHPALSIKADKVKMSQILINLVSNAIKYSSENSNVEIGVEDTPTAVRFWVRDHGVGISKENQRIIFETFRQVDGGNTRSKGGTGLGLAITKKLVELHKGEIRVESEEGLGTTFWVDIPRKVEAQLKDEKNTSMSPLEEGNPSAEVTGQKKDTIVIIDDDLNALESSSLALNDIGYATEILRDPSQALARIEELKPKLIILDIMMPKISGVTILQQLRANEQLKDSPVLVSSGYYSNREIVSEMGAHFIAKPWTGEELTQKIAEILGGENALA